METAAEGGIDIIDTSQSYGRGPSEIICGFLVDRYPSINISTEFSIPVNISNADLQRYIFESCNESLNRLRSTTLKYYVLHNDLNIDDIDILCESIVTLKRKKMIGKFFVSNATLDTLKLIKNYALRNKLSVIDGIQLRKNILYSGDALQKFAVGYGHKVFAFSPLSEGLLTGKYLAKDPLPDSRLSQVTRHLEYYQELRSSKMTKRVVAPKIKAEKNGLSLLEYSYLDVFSSRSIHKVIIGPSNRKQLKEAIRCELLGNRIQ